MHALLWHYEAILCDRGGALNTLHFKKKKFDQKF